MPPAANAAGSAYSLLSAPPLYLGMVGSQAGAGDIRRPGSLMAAPPPLLLLSLLISLRPFGYDIRVPIFTSRSQHRSALTDPYCIRTTEPLIATAIVQSGDFTLRWPRIAGSRTSVEPVYWCTAGYHTIYDRSLSSSDLKIHKNVLVFSVTGTKTPLTPLEHPAAETLSCAVLVYPLFVLAYTRSQCAV